MFSNYLTCPKTLNSPVSSTLWQMCMAIAVPWIEYTIIITINGWFQNNFFLNYLFFLPGCILLYKQVYLNDEIGLNNGIIVAFAGRYP